MVFDRCYGCMQKLSHPGEICPKCGKDNREIATVQPAYALPCGATLHGKYVIGSVLGQGGFGITYIAWDTVLETRVCIKEYYPFEAAMRDASRSSAVHWSSSGNAQELRQGQSSFLKEARKGVKLRELPSVVKVYDVFQDNDTAYIVMEYIDGVTLLNYLRQRGTLNESEIMELLAPVLKDLEKIHQRGIIHQSISPDNLMLRENETTKLLGFDTSVDLNGNPLQNNFPTTRRGFSPIEQYTHNNDIGPWTDVYAMCATIVFCVSGRLLPGSPERVLGKNTDLNAFTPAVANVLEEGLRVKPEDRIQSMGELLTKLQAATGIALKENATLTSGGKLNGRRCIRCHRPFGRSGARVAGKIDYLRKTHQARLMVYDNGVINESPKLIWLVKMLYSRGPVLFFARGEEESELLAELYDELAFAHPEWIDEPLEIQNYFSDEHIRTDQTGISLWAESVQGIVENEVVHLGERANYFPEKRKVVIERWGPDGTTTEEIAVPASVNSRSEAILFLSKDHSVPINTLKEVKRETGNNHILAAKQEVFEGHVGSGSHAGITFYKDGKKVCEITGRKYPFSWTVIRGFGYTWLSSYEPDTPLISACPEERLIVDSGTRKTAFQMLFVNRNEYQIEIEDKQITALISAREISYSYEGKTVAVCKVTEDALSGYELPCESQIQSVNFFMSVPPACILAILSFPSLLFGTHDFTGTWSAAALEADYYRCFSIKHAEFRVSKMDNKAREEFAELMQNMHWENDNELYWLSMLEPPYYYLSPSLYQLILRTESIFIIDRLNAFLKLLARSFPGLEVTIEMGYGGSNALRYDTGGQVSFIIKNGEAICDDLPYS